MVTRSAATPAAVAREVLAIYRDDDVLASAAAKASRIRSAIDAMSEIPGVAGPRALGMCAAFDVGSTGYMGRIGWDGMSLQRGWGEIGERTG